MHPKRLGLRKILAYLYGPLNPYPVFRELKLKILVFMRLQVCWLRNKKNREIYDLSALTFTKTVHIVPPVLLASYVEFWKKKSYFQNAARNLYIAWSRKMSTKERQKTKNEQHVLCKI